MNDAKDWLQRNGHDREIILPAFTAAVIASGISYSDPVRFPIDLEFALARGDVAKPVATWRAVLEAGRLPEPVPLNRPVPYIVEQQTMIQPRDPVVDARGSAGARVQRS